MKGLTQMREIGGVAAALAIAAVAYAADVPANTLTAEEKKAGYVLIFNGKDFDGWGGDAVLWSVENGAIVGSSDDHPFKVNTFLIYKGVYKNFLLKGDIKLRNHNSGIQFRSEQLPGPGWIVKGLQADASEVGPQKSAWGNLYEERGRGRDAMKTPDQGWLIAKDLVHHQDWNSYEILADGDHVQLTFNGKVTIDMHDSNAVSAGVIALQMHAGEPMRVEFRNLKLKVLP
jgi:hypothetical protein